MDGSPRYQFRHSIKHLDKVVGQLAAICEKEYHGEAIQDLQVDMASRRIPDAQAFVFKIAGLAGVSEANLGDWARHPDALRVAQEMAPCADSNEESYAVFRGAVVKLAPDYRALMHPDWGPGPDTISATVVEELQFALLTVANHFGVNLHDAYHTRIGNVRHAKLA